LLPVLAIQASAGLRTEETMRLDWSEVDQVRGYITVSAKKAKTARRRLIPIANNLAQWLRPYAGMSGLAWPKGGRFYHKAINRLRSAIGMTHFPLQPNPNGCGPYTTLETSPVTREAPYLYVDARGHYKVFVPSVQRNSMGTTWGGGSVAGSSISIDDDFFIAKPTDSVQKINSALAQGQNLLFTPGIYYLDRTIKVKRPDTVVLGLGFPTLVPNNGVVAMSVADVPGVKLSGLLFDAGPLNSPVLLQVGTWNAHKSDPDDPDPALRRVLPNRRRDRRQGHDQPCREQRQRHSGRHLGLAGGPRYRSGLDGQHRRHGRDRW
jgi:Phage integrase family